MTWTGAGTMAIGIVCALASGTYANRRHWSRWRRAGLVMGIYALAEVAYLAVVFTIDHGSPIPHL